MSDVVNPFRYQLECTPSSATLYLGGDRFTQENVRHLASLARALPAGIRTLRADARAITSLSLDALMDFRLALGEWRAVRGGEIRLLAHTPKECLVTIHSAPAVARAFPRSWPAPRHFGDVRSSAHPAP